AEAAYRRAYGKGLHRPVGGRRLPVARVQRTRQSLEDLAPVQALQALPFPSRLIGSCLVIHANALAPDLYALLPTDAAVITDPPYGVHFAFTRTRRSTQLTGLHWKALDAGTVEAQWGDNVVGDDRPFDPTPWPVFRQVILWGANHYAAALPNSPGWIVWDKLRNARAA